MQAAQSFDREECLALIAEAYRDSVPTGLDQFRDALSDWNLHGYGRGKVDVVAIVKGPEIHTAFRSGSVWCRHYVRDALLSLINQYGYALTAVRRENLRGQRFVTRIGFVQTDADDRHIYYRIERLANAFHA